MRQSVKAKRDPVAFEREQSLQTVLHHAVATRQWSVYYFDASGFSTTPCVPYGWQKLGETRELPTTPSRRLNVLGFMSLNNDSFFHTVEGPVDSQAAIATFDAFAARYAPTFAHKYLHKLPEGLSEFIEVFRCVSCHDVQHGEQCPQAVQ